MIEVRDYRTGYTARVKVPEDLLNLALSDPSDPSNEALLASIENARKHICLQAKVIMAKPSGGKRGRHKGWLDWEHIKRSIVIVAEDVPSAKAKARAAKAK